MAYVRLLDAPIKLAGVQESDGLLRFESTSHVNLLFLVTELISFSSHCGRVVSRSCSPVSLVFGNLLKPVKLMTLPFSSLLQCLIGNAAVPPVNAAGNDLAVADLVWGRLRA